MHLHTYIYTHIYIYVYNVNAFLARQAHAVFAETSSGGEARGRTNSLEDARHDLTLKDRVWGLGFRV